LEERGRDLFIDREYRTLLGTGFYDRRRDLCELEKRLQSVRTLAVYGPGMSGRASW